MERIIVLYAYALLCFPSFFIIKKKHAWVYIYIYMYITRFIRWLRSIFPVPEADRDSEYTAALFKRHSLGSFVKYTFRWRSCNKFQ